MKYGCGVVDDRENSRFPLRQGIRYMVGRVEARPCNPTIDRHSFFLVSLDLGMGVVPSTFCDLEAWCV